MYILFYHKDVFGIRPDIACKGVSLIKRQCARACVCVRECVCVCERERERGQKVQKDTVLKLQNIWIPAVSVVVVDDV